MTAEVSGVGERNVVTRAMANSSSSMERSSWGGVEGAGGREPALGIL